MSDRGVSLQAWQPTNPLPCHLCRVAIGHLRLDLVDAILFVLVVRVHRTRKHAVDHGHKEIEFFALEVAVESGLVPLQAELLARVKVRAVPKLFTQCVVVGAGVTGLTLELLCVLFLNARGDQLSP